MNYFDQYTNALAAFKDSVKELKDAIDDVSKVRGDRFSIVITPEAYEDMMVAHGMTMDKEAQSQLAVKERFIEYKIAHAALLKLLPDKITVEMPGQGVVRNDRNSICIDHNAYTTRSSFLDEMGDKRFKL